ncbi:MAG: virulence RhuM family protein [Candidatus Cloacimonetes bacterium]|nr:virulence RhuM family protein [Candidatus Cloacimonadota bacterium]
MNNQNEIILYQPDGMVEVEVRLENENIWLTQSQIALLFGTKRPAITKHLNNIYKTDELDENTTCSILEHVGHDNKQTYKTKYYNLDAILSVGYRVNSKNATLFRKWATNVLKEYMLKGYAINSRFERIEHRLTETEKQIDFFVKTSLPPIQGVFFEGQIFDAYVLASDISKSAKQSIILIDNYIDESVLTMLSKKSKDIRVTLLTRDISEQLKLDIDKFNQQYPLLEAKTFNVSHDRFLIIDNKAVYHLGASMKDLGKKWFAFTKLDLDGLSLLDKLQDYMNAISIF